MDIRKLQRVIVDGLEGVKAQHIVVFNTEHLSSLFERVIIASGTSHRQTRALASAVREEVRNAGYPVPRLEGEANGEWIIIDCGAAVVHAMQPAIREYYNLEEIWGGKPVNMKIASAPKKLVKAAEPVAETRVGTRKVAPETRAAPARKASAKKSPATRAPATKAPAKRAPAKTSPTRKAAPTKAPAKRAPTRKAAAPVTRVVGVKRAVAGKAPAKKTARKA